MLLASTDTDGFVLQNAELWLAISTIVFMGVVTAITIVFLRMRQTWRWRAYKRLIDIWLPASCRGLAEEMNEKEWRVLCATLLGDAGFSPFETQRLLEVAVMVAQGSGTLGARLSSFLQTSTRPIKDEDFRNEMESCMRTKKGRMWQVRRISGWSD